jgi:hypothetical protein
MVGEAIGTARAGGATGQIVLRGHAADGTGPVVAAEDAVTRPRNPAS